MAYLSKKRQKIEEVRRQYPIKFDSAYEMLSRYDNKTVSSIGLGQEKHTDIDQEGLHKNNKEWVR